jgi:hypothetical protein
MQGARHMADIAEMWRMGELENELIGEVEHKESGEKVRWDKFKKEMSKEITDRVTFRT